MTRRRVILVGLGGLALVLVGAVVSRWMVSESAAQRWGAATLNCCLLALLVAVCASFSGAAVGLVLAMFAGARSSRLAALAIDMGASVPSLMLVGLLRLSDPDRGLLGLGVGLLIRQFFEMAHFVRVRGTELMSLPYLEVSRAMGASRRFQVRHHLLRVLATPLSARLVLCSSSVLVMEAALTYLGLGMPQAVASLGWGIQTSPVNSGGFFVYSVTLTGLCGVLNLVAWAISSPPRQPVRLGGSAAGG